VLLFMYSDCINSVDPHTIIIIFLMFGWYFMVIFTDGFSFLCSIRAIDIFIILSTLFIGLRRTISHYIIGLIVLAFF
jgi:hypothetical protein